MCIHFIKNFTVFKYKYIKNLEFCRRICTSLKTGEIRAWFVCLPLSKRIPPDTERNVALSPIQLDLWQVILHTHIAHAKAYLNFLHRVFSYIVSGEIRTATANEAIWRSANMFVLSEERMSTAEEETWSRKVRRLDRNTNARHAKRGKRPVAISLLSRRP